MKNLFSDWLSQKIPLIKSKKEEGGKHEEGKKNVLRILPGDESKQHFAKPVHQPSQKEYGKNHFRNSRNRRKHRQRQDDLAKPMLAKSDIIQSVPKVIRKKISGNPRNLIGFDESRPFYHGPDLKQPPRLRVIPIGGTDEVGQNCMLVEYGKDMLLIDMGFAFPGKDSLGVDYFIPDLEYVYKNVSRLKGIIITHGHLDHIGALPYVMEKLNFAPIYATKLTAGFIKNRLDEFKLTKLCNVVTIDPKETLIFGGLKVGFYRVAHSIPDAIGVYIKTDTGSMVHSGDFKFCDEPSDGIPQDLEKMRTLGEKNIDVLFADSTNALTPGHTLSDKVVAENLDKLIAESADRVIIATFSSQLGRMQEIINSAVKHNRYICITGKSIETNFKIAKELGYLKYPENLIKDQKSAKNISDNNLIILSTGSQGEPQASIHRMIKGEHDNFKIKKTDTVIFSSSPIPGNEVAVYDMINNVSRLGARVVYSKIAPIHTSGHAYIEECKELIRLIKPKFIAPIHGTHFMRKGHGDIAIAEGMPKENVKLIDNGDILEIHNGEVKLLKERIPARHVIVDGQSRGVEGTNVINDRQKMSEGGVLIINIKLNRSRGLAKKPLLISKGLFYENEITDLEEKISQNIMKNYDNFMQKNDKISIEEIKHFISRNTSNYLHNKLDKNPLVLPIIDFV